MIDVERIVYVVKRAKIHARKPGVICVADKSHSLLFLNLTLLK